jgi:phosphoribosylformimino-5-aminoimidazole carboxamide ribotide isomerase
MEIWAAIDLHRDQVVSLRRGRLEESTLWSTDPLKIASRWQREGAYGLHVVDLDAALGDVSSRTVVKSIVRNARIPVEVGGGIRRFDDVRNWLSLGTDRVVLGTLPYENPSELGKIIKIFGPERIVVAVDYRNETIVTHGWVKKEDLKVIDAVNNLQAAGVETVLATATEFDGMAKGPDLPTLHRLRRSTTMHILASGGVRTINDVRELQKIGVEGVIAGRALYEGTLRLSELNLGM